MEKQAGGGLLVLALYIAYNIHVRNEYWVNILLFIFTVRNKKSVSLSS